MSIKLRRSTSADVARLMEVWEASVKATHDFLAKEDIQFFKSAIAEHKVFGQADITCAVTTDDVVIGFVGVAGDSLEMLFIDPEYRGVGIGKMLTLYAIHDCAVRKVDVNEQNLQAVGFYERMGFVTKSRSDVDGMGKPFPLLQMELR